MQDAELQLSEHFVVPLLEALKSLTQQVQAASPADTAALKQLLGTARLALRTFFSMNSPGLTPVRAAGPASAAAGRLCCMVQINMSLPHMEQSPACLCPARLMQVSSGQGLLQAFEKTLPQWMEQFHTLLTYSNTALAEPAPDTESALDAVKAAVCQNINLLIGRDEEEFEPFLARFVEAVWMQLVSVTLNPGQVCVNVAQLQARLAVWAARSAAQFSNALLGYVLTCPYYSPVHAAPLQRRPGWQDDQEVWLCACRTIWPWQPSAS